MKKLKLVLIFLFMQLALYAQGEVEDSFKSDNLSKTASFNQ